MSAAFKRRLAAIVAALWWGSLTTLGALVVPLLFKRMDTPAEAGALAAQLFSAQTWVSAACGVFLMMLLNPRSAASEGTIDASQRLMLGCIVAGLLCALLVEFAVAPQIVNARASGGSLRWWHGLGSAMFVGQWACSALVLWQLGKHKPASA
ncbi:MAG: DUF4149 domain-containing protein [Pseudomonadota bacterium]